MNTIDKHVELMKQLGEHTTVLQRCERVSIEQKFKPYFRTFIAMGQKMDAAELQKLADLAESLTMDFNPFKAGGVVSTMTFADMDEKRPG